MSNFLLIIRDQSHRGETNGQNHFSFHESCRDGHVALLPSGANFFQEDL